MSKNKKPLSSHGVSIASARLMVGSIMPRPGDVLVALAKRRSTPAKRRE
jgi:hypothetical protein